MDRRRFLKTTGSGTFAAIGVGAAISPLWSAAAEKTSNDRILVVLQLSGGNDGLNTIVPFSDDAYKRNRLTLAYNKSNVLSINDYLGFHPSLGGLAKLFEQRHLAVIQGVGYPNPNRSHFESMDLWHTAHGMGRSTGWLGRWCDANRQVDAPSSIYVGRGVRPLALQSRSTVPLTVRKLDQFRLGGQEMRSLVEEASAASTDDDDLLGLVAGSLATAAKADRQLSEAMNLTGEGGYPSSGLGQDLRTVATMIRANMPARIYYVTLDGFDTHANQRDGHAALLQQFASSLQSFCDDLQSDNLLDQVMIMSFSEFGRRVKENGSQGTDHGVAGPMFLAGGAVQSGVVGAHPSLTDLDDGDLKYHTDYRSVYATILENWLGLPTEATSPAEEIIAGNFPALPNLVTDS